MKHVILHSGNKSAAAGGGGIVIENGIICTLVRFYEEGVDMKKVTFIFLLLLFTYSIANAQYYNPRETLHDDEYEKESKSIYLESLYDTYRECLKHGTSTDCAKYDPGLYWDFKNDKRITWKCVDATSYDGNAYNDNKCTSSKGEVKYVSDSFATKLDTKYKPGKSGASYYNNK